VGQFGLKGEHSKPIGELPASVRSGSVLVSTIHVKVFATINGL
jgi:hypothetical protein